MVLHIVKLIVYITDHNYLLIVAVDFFFNTSQVLNRWFVP